LIVSFSEKEKGRIRHFLGYPSWSNMAASIQLGFPAGSQPLYILEQAFNRLLPDGEASVRTDLCECESIEMQLASARKRFRAQQLGNLKANLKETHQLRDELVFWQRRLADDLGVPFNPYSSMGYKGMPGGMNASVE
jgi:hypothetical protein